LIPLISIGFLFIIGFVASTASETTDFPLEVLRMLRTPLGRLRVIGLTEGISYLVLLLIAMPLKYYAGLPAAVTIVGALHGLFFVLYLLAVAHVTYVRRWSFGRVLGALVASLVPFGNFVLDMRLRREM
jgi:integral membrane protein